MKKPDKALYTALKRLNDKGYEAYLVGGALRDFLLGKTISDYDITTNANPEAIRMVFNDYTCYDVGKKHGTVTVLIDKFKIDITPYRIESDYNDHRHPEKVIFSSNLKDDLSRRDFTINAMCLDIDNNIIDYYHGLKDLENRIIRTVGNPETRFHEDALRILRAIRFKAQLDFVIEKKTDRQIHKSKDLLKYISEERKKEELLHILSFKSAFMIINEYLDVFNTFMPFKEIRRKNNNFKDPFYALSYLLKDEKDLKLKQLKYSNKEIDLIKTLIAATKISINNDEQFISYLSNIYQNETLQFLNQYHRKNFTSRYKRLKKYMVSINELAIDGKQIEKHGYTGPMISRVKHHLVDMIHAKKLENSHEALNNYLNKHKIIR